MRLLCHGPPWPKSEFKDNLDNEKKNSLILHETITTRRPICLSCYNIGQPSSHRITRLLHPDG